jgi:hypothetical protein
MVQGGHPGSLNVQKGESEFRMNTKLAGNVPRVAGPSQTFNYLFLFNNKINPQSSRQAFFSPGGHFPPYIS